MTTLADLIRWDQQLRANGGVIEDEPTTEITASLPLDTPTANRLRGELLAWRQAHERAPLPGVGLGSSADDWWAWCCRADEDLLRQALTEALALEDAVAEECPA